MIKLYSKINCGLGPIEWIGDETTRTLQAPLQASTQNGRVQENKKEKFEEKKTFFRQ